MGSSKVLMLKSKVLPSATALVPTAGRHQLWLLPASIRHIEESIKYVHNNHHNTFDITKANVS